MRLLGFFFQLLYHQFAWLYDLVAAVVSLGGWQSWGLTALPYLEGGVLELGFGTGHLQSALRESGLQAYGLDESKSMIRLTAKRMRRQGQPANLVRGYAQNLPFRSGTIKCAVATFPSEFIFHERTLAEIRRVLAQDGRLVIIPTAWITGTGILNRLAAGLFRVTGQAGIPERIALEIRERLQTAGFQVRHELVELQGSRVLVVIARKLEGL